MSEPNPVKVTRYRCPHCGRSHSGKSRCVKHMERCWFNPDARGCKTCAHFQAYLPADCDGLIVYSSDIAERCLAGNDLTANLNCAGCAGAGEIGATGVRCGPCDGGTFLRIHCAEWAPSPRHADEEAGE